jgi:Fe-S cluster assembly scaffold protein SufB
MNFFQSLQIHPSVNKSYFATVPMVYDNFFTTLNGKMCADWIFFYKNEFRLNF